MIYCVEDEGSIRDIEEYALRSAGFETRGFADGTAFWDALQTERPQLVVLDVMLPGIDGITLLKRIHGEDEHPQYQQSENRSQNHRFFVHFCSSLPTTVLTAVFTTLIFTLSAILTTN